MIQKTLQILNVKWTVLNFNSNIEEKLIGNYMNKWLVDKNISVHIYSNFFLKGYWTDGVSDKGILK